MEPTEPVAPEFAEHIEELTDLVNQVEDPDLRWALFASIETLANQVQGPWLGCKVAWIDGSWEIEEVTR